MFTIYPNHISDILFNVKFIPINQNHQTNLPFSPLRLACRVVILLSCTGRHSCQWQKHRKNSSGNHLDHLWSQNPVFCGTRFFFQVMLKASCQNNNTMSSLPPCIYICYSIIIIFIIIIINIIIINYYYVIVEYPTSFQKKTHPTIKSFVISAWSSLSGLKGLMKEQPHQVVRCNFPVNFCELAPGSTWILQGSRSIQYVSGQSAKQKKNDFFATATTTFLRRSLCEPQNPENCQLVNFRQADLSIIKGSFGSLDSVGLWSLVRTISVKWENLTQPWK